MKKSKPELIVMLTHNDKTVENAFDVFDKYKDSKATYWGFKESGILPEEMKKLYSYMTDCGKKTVLEVVSYTEQECLKGAYLAAEYGCDILMGTLFFNSVNRFCQRHNIKYMPFIGNVTGRPSVLNGEIKDIIDEANKYLKQGIYGFDLLGYRYTGDVNKLLKEFVLNVNAPVCIAGSINSYSRLDMVKEANPWAFTVGGAFFENKFKGSFGEQINKVYNYAKEWRNQNV